MIPLLSFPLPPRSSPSSRALPSLPAPARFNAPATGNWHTLPFVGRIRPSRSRRDRSRKTDRPVSTGRPPSVPFLATSAPELAMASTSTHLLLPHPGTHDRSRRPIHAQPPPPTAKQSFRASPTMLSTLHTPVLSLTPDSLASLGDLDVDSLSELWGGERFSDLSLFASVAHFLPRIFAFARSLHQMQG